MITEGARMLTEKKTTQMSRQESSLITSRTD